MRRWLGQIASRRLPPLVFAAYLLLYVGVACVHEEPLVWLVEAAGGNSLLLGPLLLLPVNFAARLIMEIRNPLAPARMLAAGERFDERVVSRPNHLAEAAEWLRGNGYRMRQTADTLHASRGISLRPVRLVFLAGMFFLFLGIFLSLALRQVTREVIIEGEPLPARLQSSLRVAAIKLEEARGLSPFARDLTIHLAATAGGAAQRLGLYPPDRIAGRFVYPRYLGVAPRVVLSGPDLPQIADYYLLMLYPPGREDSIALPDSNRKIAFRLQDSPEDPYVTGAFHFVFRIVQDDEVVATGVVPAGGSFVDGGIRLAIPDARRIVHADFIADPGLPLLWLALLLLPAALFAGLLIRIVNPRREIFLIPDAGRFLACTRAEGRRLRHAGVFSKMLDILEQERSGNVRNDD